MNRFDTAKKGMCWVVILSFFAQSCARTPVRSSEVPIAKASDPTVLDELKYIDKADQIAGEFSDSSPGATESNDGTESDDEIVADSADASRSIAGDDVGSKRYTGRAKFARGSNGTWRYSGNFRETKTQAKRKMALLVKRANMARYHSRKAQKLADALRMVEEQRKIAEEQRAQMQRLFGAQVKAYSKYAYGNVPIELEKSAADEIEALIKKNPELQFDLSPIFFKEDSVFNRKDSKVLMVDSPQEKGEKILMVMRKANSLPSLIGGTAESHFVEMTASMASFYAGMAILTYYECASTGDDFACREFKRSLRTPEGWIGFYLFSLSAKWVGAGIGRITPSRWPQRVKGVLGGGGMVAGMFVQSLFNQLSPGIKAYRDARFKSDPKERVNAKKLAVDMLYKEALSNPEWWVQQVPGLAGLIGGVIAAKFTINAGKAVGKKTINFVGKLIWRGGKPILETAEKKAINGAAVLPLLRLGFRGTKFVPYLGVFLSFAEHVVEVPIMLAWTHQIEKYLTPWYNTMVHRHSLNSEKYEFFKALENYLAFYGKKINPNSTVSMQSLRSSKRISSEGGFVSDFGEEMDKAVPKESQFDPKLSDEERALKLVHAHRHMEEAASKLHDMWNAHRDLSLSSAHQAMSARSMEVNTIDQQLSQIKAGYEWANKSLSTRSLAWSQDRGNWKEWFYANLPSEKKFSQRVGWAYSASTAISYFKPEIGLPIFAITAGIHAWHSFSPIPMDKQYFNLKLAITRGMFCGPKPAEAIDKAYKLDLQRKETIPAAKPGLPDQSRLPLFPDTSIAYELNQKHFPLFEGDEIEPFGIIDYAEAQKAGIDLKRKDYCPDYMMHLDEAKSGKFVFNLEEGLFTAPGKDGKTPARTKDFTVSANNLLQGPRAGGGPFLQKICAEEVKREGGSYTLKNREAELHKYLFCSDNEAREEWGGWGIDKRYEAVSEFRRVSLLAGPPRLPLNSIRRSAIDFHQAIESAYQVAADQAAPVQNFLLRKAMEETQDHLMEGIFGKKIEKTLLPAEKDSDGYYLGRRFKWNDDHTEYQLSGGWPVGYLAGLTYERDFWIEMNRQYGEYTDRFTKIINAIEASQSEMENFVEYVKDPFHKGEEAEKILNGVLDDMMKSHAHIVRDQRSAESDARKEVKEKAQAEAALANDPEVQKKRKQSFADMLAKLDEEIKNSKDPEEKAQLTQLLEMLTAQAPKGEELFEEGADAELPEDGRFAEDVNVEEDEIFNSQTKISDGGDSKDNDEGAKKASADQDSGGLFESDEEDNAFDATDGAIFSIQSASDSPLLRAVNPDSSLVNIDQSTLNSKEGQQYTSERNLYTKQEKALIKSLEKMK